MRYSAERKKETKAAILQAATKVFKEVGFQSGSVDKVMDTAGLTAGGFYAHFPSKEQLFAETLSKAFKDAEAMLEQGLDDDLDEGPGNLAKDSKKNLDTALCVQHEKLNEVLDKTLKQARDTAWVRNFLRRYMSRAHRKDTLRGCAIPPLISEVSRANKPAKQALENYFKDWRAKIKGKLADKRDKSERDATALIAICLGAISIARAVSDEALADEILEDCFQFAREAIETSQVE